MQALDWMEASLSGVKTQVSHSCPVSLCLGKGTQIRDSEE